MQNSSSKLFIFSIIMLISLAYGIDTFADSSIPHKESPKTHFLAIKNSTAEPICVTSVEKLVQRHYAEFFYDYLYENENIFNPSEQQLQDALYQKIESTRVYQLFTEQYQISEKRDGIWGKGWGPFNLSSYNEEKTKIAFVQFINSPDWGFKVHVSCKFADSTSYATLWSATYDNVWESGLYEYVQLLANNYCLDDYVSDNLIDLTMTLELHTSEEQERIDLWEDCRFGHHAMILEKFPAICVLDNENRYEQPVFIANEFQWESCISLDNSILLDNDTKCIATNEVVYYMKQ